MPHGARGPSCGDGRVLGVLDYWLVTVVGVASPENGEIVISNGMHATVLPGLPTSILRVQSGLQGAHLGAALPRPERSFRPTSRRCPALPLHPPSGVPACKPPGSLSRRRLSDLAADSTLACIWPVACRPCSVPHNESIGAAQRSVEHARRTAFPGGGG